MLRRLFTLVVTVCLLSASWASVHAQQTQTVKFFIETGHNVGGDFLKYYNSNANATILYGYPLTEEFKNKDGRIVQYFQRARFEYWPELSEGQRVVPTSLGRETYASTGSLNVNNAFACRTYSETGFAVCFAFLEFFDQYGGVTQFGYPISGFEYHENKLVQYFEKARLEWQPWKVEGQRVAVSDLGRIYFDKLREDPALLLQVKPLDNTIQTVTYLQVRAFVWKAVTQSSDSQMIYIIVQDQALQPVPNASCTASIQWADERTDSNTVSTNTSGIGLVALSFTNQPQGSLINIDVSCVSNNQTSSTRASFRIWY
ncbi:MAG: hypothetical protein HY863_21835 [Chloroflexi bacterium]|nr:hypothetical protein [Chloroflexota bacterium]